jgi:hypothetical protein
MIYPSLFPVFIRVGLGAEESIRIEMGLHLLCRGEFGQEFTGVLVGRPPSTTSLIRIHFRLGIRPLA